MPTASPSREFRGQWLVHSRTPEELRALAEQYLPEFYTYTIEREEFNKLFEGLDYLKMKREENERPGSTQHSPAKKKAKKKENVWDSLGRQQPQTDTQDKRVIREDLEVEWTAGQIRLIRSLLSQMIRDYDIAKQIIDASTMTEDDLKSMISYLYRELMLLSNYYTQLANDNILPASGSDAYERTCNITSTAMGLNGLGVTNKNFNGDWELLALIQLIISKTVKEDDLLDAEKLAPLIEKGQKLLGNVDDTRMPDFVQYVAIYSQMKILEMGPDVFKTKYDSTVAGLFEKNYPSYRSAKSFYQQVTLAASVVAPRISTDAYIFRDLPPYFGAMRVGLNNPSEVFDRCFTLNKADGYWKQEEVKVNRIIKKLTDEIKKLNKSSLANKDELIEKLNDKIVLVKESISKEKVEDSKRNHIEKHKGEVNKIVTPFINSGFQCVVNREGHYVRLENIETDGIRVDDPYAGMKGKSEGKSTYLSWEQSSKVGMFKAFHLLCLREEKENLIQFWKATKSLNETDFEPEFVWQE